MSQFPDEQSEDGGFTRQEDAFREMLQKAESGRYHLYVSLACPWAHRTLIVLELLGLQEAVGVTVVDPVRDERGWAFRDGPGHTADPVNGFSFLAEAYHQSNPDFKGRVTVPVLWDKQESRIVNNSEDDICRMFGTAFQPHHAHSVDLFPAELAHAQDELSNYVYENVNNGVYKAGFATSQKEYERAFLALFEALEKLEQRLASQLYLMGDSLTETDWRLFCTLIRFDAVYHGHFKCNLRQIRDYPQLSSYLRHLYQMPGIASTVNMDHIKRHYYVTHDDINPTGIVPLGPDLSWLEVPSDRQRSPLHVEAAAS